MEHYAGLDVSLELTRHERESLDDRASPPRPARPRSHRWDGEVGEAAMAAVTAEGSDDHAGKIGSPLPLTVSCGGTKPTTDRSKSPAAGQTGAA